MRWTPIHRWVEHPSNVHSHTRNIIRCENQLTRSYPHETLQFKNEHGYCVAIRSDTRIFTDTHEQKHRCAHIHRWLEHARETTSEAKINWAEVIHMTPQDKNERKKSKYRAKQTVHAVWKNEELWPSDWSLNTQNSTTTQLHRTTHNTTRGLRWLWSSSSNDL